MIVGEESKKISLKNEKDYNKNEDITIQKYEKIGNLTLFLDKYSFSVLSFFLMVILSTFMFWFLLYQSIISYSDPFFPNVILIGGFVIGILLSFILIIIYVILSFAARINEIFRHYNKEKIVKLYLYELAENLSDKRKHEIMTHLLYNISRIRRQYVNSRVMLMRSLHWSSYNRVRNEKRKIIIQTINNLIEFLGSLYLFSYNNSESQFLKTAGDYIEKRNYLNLAKELKKKHKLFEKNWKLFESDEKISIRGYIKKSLYGLEWLSKYGNGLLGLIISLIILYFLWRGYLVSIPYQ